MRTRSALRASFLALLPLATLTLSAAATAVPVSIVGTNDLHGRIERIAHYAGHVAILREKAKAAGGGVIVVDAGDMFQGTLESNLVEGKSVIAAYNILRPTAVAIGNHEFDFGPVGPRVMPKAKSDDPRGALKARAAEASFPFLAANIIDEATGKPVAWPNVKPSVLVKAGPVPVGIIGVTTKDTARTTVALNYAGLRTAPLAETVQREAQALRQRGARVVVLVAHAGGKCHDLSNPTQSESCEADAEIFEVARALPAGLVDVIVAGHTHSTVAHVIHGVPVIESWANGKGFGRVDFDVDPRSGKVTLVKVHQPQPLCADDRAAVCAPSPYEGKAVKPDARIAKAMKPFLDRAQAVKDKSLGVTILRTVERGYDQESALGNLFADLMLAGSPGADIAIMNGGGIRADLPEGPLTYGHVYEMMPFDNRFARITTTGATLRRWLESNLSARKGGILSVAGMTATVTCRDGNARVSMQRKDGKPIRDDDRVVIATSDFLATGGDSTNLTDATIALDEGEPIRETLAALLETRGGVLRGDDPALFHAGKRRLAPGRCPSP